MVAAGAFDTDAWQRLQHRLERSSGGGVCDPINGVGYPRLFARSAARLLVLHPFDPAMPNLPIAAISPRWRASSSDSTKARPGHSPRRVKVQVERGRYVPEVGAILRYTT